MDNLKEQLQKAINDIDFNNLCENHKDTIEKALVMLQVKWENNKSLNLTSCIGSWDKTTQPLWNWQDSNYIIVSYSLSQPKELVPFDYSDAEYLIKKALPVRYHNDNIYKAITHIGLQGVILSDGTNRSFKRLLDDYEFSKGKPCGKEVEV